MARPFATLPKPMVRAPTRSIHLVLGNARHVLGMTQNEFVPLAPRRPDLLQFRCQVDVRPSGSRKASVERVEGPQVTVRRPSRRLRFPLRRPVETKSPWQTTRQKTQGSGGAGPPPACRPRKCRDPRGALVSVLDSSPRLRTTRSQRLESCTQDHRSRVRQPPVAELGTPRRGCRCCSSVAAPRRCRPPRMSR
jgi:hypothetical protein